MYILSLFSNVVNYDSDNGWSTLLDKFKETPKITKEVQDALSALKDINMQNITSAEQLGKRIGYTNEEFFKFAKQADLSGNVLQQYKDYTQSASGATSLFSSSLKSAVANIGAMLAIMVAIKVASYVIDELYVSFEEQKEIVEDLTNSIEELQSEYDALKEDPSASGDRLNYLKKQIQYEQDLLEIEKERLALKDIKENMPDISKDTGTSGGTVNPTWTPEDVAESDIQADLSELGRIRDRIAEMHEKGTDSPSNYVYQNQIEEEKRYLQSLSDNVNYLKEDYLEIAEAKAKLEEYVSDGTLKGYNAEHAREQIAEYQEELDRLDPILINAELELGTAHFTQGYDLFLDDIQNMPLIQYNSSIKGFSGEEMSSVINSTKELNTALREGEITSTQWYNSINKLMTESEFDDAVKAVDDWTGKSTDELESMVATMSTQLGNALTESSNKFLRGETSVSDYIDELQAGSEAQLSMYESLEHLMVNEEGFATNIDETTGELTDAAKSYNELKDSIDELEDVQGLADILSDDIDFFDDYKSWADETLSSQDFQNHINELSSGIATFLQEQPEMVESFATMLEDTTGKSVDRATLLASNASTIISGIVGDNLVATQGMVGWTMDTIGTVVENASQAIGDVLIALGETIQGFEYSIEAKPYIKSKIPEKLFEVDENGGLKFNGFPSFGVDFTGKAKGNAKNLGDALTKAGNYFRDSGNKELYNKLNDINTYRENPIGSGANSVPPPSGSGGGNSGSGGGSKSKEKYVAEIDKYKELSDAVEDVESKISDLDLLLDHTDSLEGQIALNDKLIGLYKEEQDALIALNNARDKEISDNVAKLRAKGFQIDYDPKTDNLQIKNREHLNELSQDNIKDYEELIKRTDELNDANKESAKTWTELTYKIADVGKEITKLHIDQYDKYISDAEHLIELLSNRKDALGKDLPIYDKMMQQSVATWKLLVEDGYDKNREKIQELESAWMKYYDARLEREKELLEKQLDDHDSALDAILNLIDAQNKKLDDQIDSLKKVNEERKEALDLQKAQADLDKARNQKVRKVLRKDQGFIYEADQDAIKEAEETLSDKKYEAHISVLEKQKEALDEIKNKWAEIPDLFDKYQNELLASQILGADWEEKILDGREDAYEDFKDAYFDLQDDIKDKSDELENHLNESYLEMVRIFEKYGQLNASPTLSANVSTGKTWYVERDGSSPKDAQIGDIVKTKGGTYQIVAPNTPGAGYNAKTGRWNLKLDDNSADIKDGMWGTVAGTNGVTKTTTGGITQLAIDPSKNGNKQLTSAIGKNTLSNQGIVDAANDQIDTIYEGITGLEAASRYLANNSVFTQEETNVLMKHMGLVDKNSESEDANTDASDANTAGLNDNTSSQAQNTAATDDLTRAITDLSFAQMQADQYVAQNNMKEGVSNQGWLDYWDHVLELTEDPLWKGEFTQADINNALAQRNQYAQLVRQEQAVKDLMNDKEPTKVELSDKDKEIIKSLQASWNAAKEAGNEQGMELAHQLAEAVRNGYDISPTLATKSDYKLSDTTFTGGGSVGSGNKSKVQAEREWQLEKAKEFGASKDYISRLENAIAIEKYGSGSKVETYTDEQGRTSTIISSVNKAEENMSASDLKNRWDSGWRPTMNSIDKLDSGLKNTNDGLSDNSDANYYAGDSALESAEIIKDSAQTMADSVQSAYRDMVSAINSAVSSNGYGSGSGSGSGGGGRGGSSDRDSAELKQYKFAYEVAKSQGNKEAMKTIQSQIDRLSSSSSSKSKNSFNSGKNHTDSNGYTYTKGSDGLVHVKDKNGKEVGKYAKGGINLKSGTYNVDEEGSEMIIDNPQKGRWVRIGTGSSVIPADVSKNLWQFGINPKQNIQTVVLDTLRNVKISSPRTNATSSTMIHVDRVEMHGVNDVLGFMRELQSEVMNLSSDANQFMGVSSNRRMN